MSSQDGCLVRNPSNDRLTSAEKEEIIRRKNSLNQPDILRKMLIKTGYQRNDPKNMKNKKSNSINVRTNLAQMVKTIDTNENLKEYKTDLPIYKLYQNLDFNNNLLSQKAKGRLRRNLYNDSSVHGLSRSLCISSSPNQTMYSNFGSGKSP